MKKAQLKLDQGVLRVMACCAVIAGYLIARDVVYRLMPTASFDDWVRRDTVMDVPRALAAAVCLWLGLRWFGAERLGLHWRRWQLATGLCLWYCLAAWVFGRGRTPFRLDNAQLAILTFSSLIVGIFEEAAYRGCLLQSLLVWRGRTVAIWASTAIFVGFHIGAQPLWAFPQIALIGAALALARFAGCSLLALMVLHGVYDSAIFVVQGRGTPDYGRDYWIWLSLLAAPLLALWPLRSREDGEVPADIHRGRSNTEG